MFKLDDYLSKRASIPLNDNLFLIKDLRLTSKEIIDLVIFIKKTYLINCKLYKDIRIGDLKKKIIILRKESK